MAEIQQFKLSCVTIAQNSLSIVLSETVQTATERLIGVEDPALLYRLSKQFASYDYYSFIYFFLDLYF